MAAKMQQRACPYCKEPIKADALRCKHCRSSIEPEAIPHGGVCPWCKESIKIDAIKCKHCGSAVGSEPRNGDCGCHEKEPAFGNSILGRSIGDIRPGGGFNPSGEAGDFSGAGTSAAPANNCGECEGFYGATTDIRGHTRIRGQKTCCSMIPVLVGNRVIWRKFCWTQSCLHRDIYAPF